MLQRQTAAFGLATLLLSGVSAQAEYDRNLGTIYHPAPQPAVEEPVQPAAVAVKTAPTDLHGRSRNHRADADARAAKRAKRDAHKLVEAVKAAAAGSPSADTSTANEKVAKGPIEETPSPTPKSATEVESAKTDSKDGPHEQPAPTLHDLITKHAQANGLPVNLASAVIQIESRFNPRARGGGALGLMQIKYETARSAGFAGSAVALFEPDVNLRFGMKVLGDAYKESHGNLCMTLAKYQSGHLTTRMSAANRVYCAKAKSIMART